MNNDKRELRALETLERFVQYTSNPWRIMWINFVAGIFRGLGALIGASVVIAIIVWLASVFVDVPLIGEYAAQAKLMIEGFVEQTNYSDEFDRMGDSLERIEQRLEEAQLRQ